MKKYDWTDETKSKKENGKQKNARENEKVNRNKKE